MAEIKGGDKFLRAMAELARKLDTPRTLQVGFFEDAKYPDGTSVAMVAALNNFGTSRAPPRPFFSNMVRDKSPEWPKAIEGLLVRTNYDVDETLNLTGEAIKGQLQQSIRDLTSPPLAESTIKRKGFDKPLIETKLMLNSAGFHVKKS